MQELLDNKALISISVGKSFPVVMQSSAHSFLQGIIPYIIRQKRQDEQAFDAIPRVIPADQFATIEKGLIQRVKALNYFLQDVYGEKKLSKMVW